jgi:hypothetical protein
MYKEIQGKKQSNNTQQERMRGGNKEKTQI